MPTRHQRWLMGLVVAAGLALLAIGIRFIADPHNAARFFGIGPSVSPFDLHRVVALRDIWLALALIGLALLREWRALALLLALGALVCLADGAIAAASSGRAISVAFHAASGAYCAALACAVWRQTEPSR